MDLVLDRAGERIGDHDISFISVDVAPGAAIDDAVGILAIVLGQQNLVTGRPRRNVEKPGLAAVGG